MEPGFHRGDILFLNLGTAPARTGEIVVFNLDGRDVPIVHRVIKVHERTKDGHLDILTKVGRRARPGSGACACTCACVGRGFCGGECTSLGVKVLALSRRRRVQMGGKPTRLGVEAPAFGGGGGGCDCLRAGAAAAPHEAVLFLSGLAGAEVAAFHRLPAAHTTL